MNRVCTAVLPVLASVLLAGCATTPATVGKKPHALDADARYVDSVTRASRQSGVKVYWLNPPTEEDRED